MSRWKWAVLVFELALFAIILILPQVDLPDFTFHRGTAPVVIKARASSIPVQVTVAAALLELPQPERLEPLFDLGFPAVSPSSTSRLSLFCTLVC
jgi:hypothetical protein